MTVLCKAIAFTITLLIASTTALTVATTTNHSLAHRQTASTGCDAELCVQRVFEVLFPGLCIIGTILSELQGSDVSCLHNITSADMGTPCLDCRTKVACDPRDEKAWEVACGGNGAQPELHKCMQLSSSVPERKRVETDLTDGRYLWHCGRSVRLPSGITTNGGTCNFDCSQCGKCVDAGLNNTLVTNAL